MFSDLQNRFVYNSILTGQKANDLSFLLVVVVAVDGGVNEIR